MESVNDPYTRHITPRFYKLPHPDHNEIQDVIRIRETFIRIDADITKQETEYSQTKQKLKRFIFETFLTLWSV